MSMNPSDKKLDALLSRKDNAEDDVLSELDAALTRERAARNADKFFFISIIIFILSLPVFCFSKTFTSPLVLFLFDMLLIMSAAKKYGQGWAVILIDELVKLGMDVLRKRPP